MVEYTPDNLAIVMGTYDEEQAIGFMLADTDRVADGCAEVICVGRSDDRTPEIARKMGVRATEREPQGYGVAVEAVVPAPDCPIVVTMDCDDTYPMEYLLKFLDLINDGYDVVSDDRIMKGVETMSRLNRARNIAFAYLASFLMGATVHDTTTGIRVYRREFFHDIE